LRKRGGFSARNSASRKRPKEQWIEIFVPVIIGEDIFFLAQERLEKQTVLSPSHQGADTSARAFSLQQMWLCGVQVFYADISEKTLLLSLPGF
jgi:hypothetical protein